MKEIKRLLKKFGSGMFLYYSFRLLVLFAGSGSSVYFEVTDFVVMMLLCGYCLSEIEV